MALFLFAVTAYCLVRTGGMYREPFLVLFVAVWTAYCVRYFRGSFKGSFESDVFPHFVLILFLVCLVQKPYIIYASPGAALSIAHYALWVALLAAALMTGSFFRQLNKLWVCCFALVAIALVVARFAALSASPSPLIDVFIKTFGAVEHLLAARNPYAQAYPIVANAQVGDFTGFPYLPGVLYWTAPFHWLFGDFRIGFLFADVGAAGILFALGRRARLSKKTAGLVALLWLALPVSLLILVQAWNDTLVLCFAGLLVLAVQSRRFFLAGLWAGFLLITKQYAFFIPLLLGWWLWTAKHEKKAVLTIAGGAALVASVLLAPFLIADAQRFVFDTAGAFGGLTMRADSFSITAWMFNRAGYVLPVPVSLAIYLIGFCAVFLTTRLRATAEGPIAGLVVLYGVVFLFGKQAFCNYYQLIAYLTLMAGLVAAREPHTAFSRR